MSQTHTVVEFAGPFSWLGENGTKSILDSDAAIGKKCGIYLWTVPLDGGELVYYVGETGRGFAQRLYEHYYEHYKEHAPASYHLYEPTAFRAGEKVLTWEGLYRPGRSAFRQESIRRYGEFAGTVLELTETYRFYLAPLACERRLRERIEAAIAGHLYQQDGLVGGFQDRGIRYRGRTDHEAPIWVTIRSASKLQGIPSRLSV